MNSSLKTKWIVTFLAIIMIMGSTFLTSSLVTLNSIEKDIDRQNEAETVFMKNILDDSWDRIFYYCYQTLNATEAKRIERNGIQLQTAVVDNGANVLSYNLRNYSLINPIMEDLYLYYPERDILIGTKGIFSSHVYWASLSDINKTISEEEWRSTLFGVRDPGFFFMENDGDLELYYRIFSTGNEGRMLVVKVNRKELERQLDFFCSNNGKEFLAVTDDSQRILVYSGNYDQYADLETNTLLPSLSSVYISTEIESSIIPLTYVSITEKSAAYVTARSTTRIAIILLAMSTLISVAMAISFAQKNVKQVKAIISKLYDGNEPDGDEIRIIERQIDILLEENKQYLDTAIVQQNVMIRRTFLKEALNFGGLYQRDVEIIAAIYKQEFDNDNFSIVVRERLDQDNSTGIHEYLAKATNRDAILCWAQIQDVDVFLVNYDDTLPNQPDEVEMLITTLHRISSEQTRVVKSKATSQLEEIRVCYLEALQLLDRTDLIMISTAGIGDPESGSLLGVFQSLMYDENYLQARDLLPNLCELLFEQNKDTVKFTSYKYYLLSYLKLKCHTAPDGMLQKFVDGNTSFEIEKCLYEILTQMDMQKRADSTSESIANVAGKAKRFIDENYSNPMIGLCMISEQLHFSQSYVSHVFKQFYGMSVSQYINQVRVAHAKELILAGSQNIKEIALQVGFSGDRQFFRVFKKMEEVTPGNYRAEHEKKN